MKKIKEEIVYCINQLGRGEIKDRYASSRIEMLKLAKNYLLTNPKENFIVKEIERLRKEIEIIESRFDLYVSNNRILEKNKKSAYLKRFNVPYLKNQIEFLEYLIS